MVAVALVAATAGPVEGTVAAVPVAAVVEPVAAVEASVAEAAVAASVAEAAVAALAAEAAALAAAVAAAAPAAAAERVVSRGVLAGLAGFPEVGRQRSLCRVHSPARLVVEPALPERNV